MFIAARYRRIGGRGIMGGKSCRVVLLMAVLHECGSAPDIYAGVTFLGPIPYLSAADSPFPVDGSNPSFYLEDFEPEEPCIPGESAFCGAIPFEFPGIKTFAGGGGIGSSVDADDGVIDGSGAVGVSASLIPVSISGSYIFSALQIEFDAEQLGDFPNAVGLVLTEGAGQGSALHIFDQFGEEFVLETNGLHPSGNDTSDDRFIGVISSAGIASLVFEKRSLLTDIMVNTRIDHLQYGILVPEPSGESVTLISVLALLALKKLHFRWTKGSERLCRKPRSVTGS
jgi:hypothetical protein